MSISTDKLCPVHSPSKEAKAAYKEYMQHLVRLESGWTRCGVAGCLYTRR